MTNDGPLHLWVQTGAILAIASIVSTAALTKLILPFLARYAIVAPNARSSHKAPTPQGAGIAIIATIAISVVATIYFVPGMGSDPGQLIWILAATVGLTVVGALDDLFALDIWPRLLLQALAVGAVTIALPSELRIVQFLPWGVERALLFVAMLWLVNIVNFMDGVDWMTAAEVVPLTAALSLFGFIGLLPPGASLVAIALFGAMVGFAPFNRPVARVFLGDVGSLPIGLLLGWLLASLACAGHLVASLLLPLYYLADATITLLRRIIAGERFLEAHRGHFYQQAIDRGLSVFQIVGRIFGLNIILAGLAALTVINGSFPVSVIALAIGFVLVALVLKSFSNASRR